MNTSMRRIAKRPLSRFTLIVRLPRKLLEIFFLAVALPFNDGRRLLALARCLGWVTGRLSVAFGRDVDIYRNVTGN